MKEHLHAGKIDLTAGFQHGRIIEMYYRMAIIPGVNLSPSVQYVADPGGRTGDDALVFGRRARIVLE
jgi:carbohydrate-selective porin OprB